MHIIILLYFYFSLSADKEIWNLIITTQLTKT